MWKCSFLLVCSGAGMAPFIFEAPLVLCYMEPIQVFYFENEQAAVLAAVLMQPISVGQAV